LSSQPNVYPNLEELMPEVLLSRLPVTLVRDISERYLTLGGKYLSNEVHTDGRPINAMMFTSRVVNCIEEVVDGAFCMIGQAFKQQAAGEQPDDYIYDALMGLVEIYALLKAHEDEDLRRCEGVVNLV
jgi:hypothetical protein